MKVELGACTWDVLREVLTMTVTDQITMLQAKCFADGIIFSATQLNSIAVALASYVAIQLCDLPSKICMCRLYL